MKAKNKQMQVVAVILAEAQVELLVEMEVVISAEGQVVILVVEAVISVVEAVISAEVAVAASRKMYLDFSGGAHLP